MTQSDDHGQARARLTASRRAVLIAAGMAPVMVDHALAAGSPAPLFLALNECAYPPSSRVAQAIAAETGQLSRYADPADAGRLTATLARIEQVTPDQIVLGDVLEPLGRYLAAGTGGSFVYSLPGYTALVDAAKPLGGRGVGVPLDRGLGNDLAALSAATGSDTRALFLVNPHNPSGTVTPRAAWHAFLAEAAHRTLVIVDEAYIEYDEPGDSAVALTRSGANVAVFRTFDKIHALAALPFGYAVVPLALGRALRAAGIGDPHALSRLALAAAAAAVEDTTRVAAARAANLAARERLHVAIDALGLKRSASRGNFVFFRSPVGGDTLRARLIAGGIVPAHAFAPLNDWVRITVGNDAEVTRTIAVLRAALV
jgi:histidinol-phosphate aminotransferase